MTKNRYKKKRKIQYGNYWLKQQMQYNDQSSMPYSKFQLKYIINIYNFKVRSNEIYYLSTMLKNYARYQEKYHSQSIIFGS